MREIWRKSINRDWRYRRNIYPRVQGQTDGHMSAKHIASEAYFVCSGVFKISPIWNCGLDPCMDPIFKAQASLAR